MAPISFAALTFSAGYLSKGRLAFFRSWWGPLEQLFSSAVVSSHEWFFWFSCGFVGGWCRTSHEMVDDWRLSWPSTNLPIHFFASFAQQKQKRSWALPSTSIWLSNAFDSGTSHAFFAIWAHFLRPWKSFTNTFFSKTLLKIALWPSLIWVILKKAQLGWIQNETFLLVPIWNQCFRIGNLFHLPWFLQYQAVKSFEKRSFKFHFAQPCLALWELLS